MPEQFTPEEMDLLIALEQKLQEDDTCDKCMSTAAWSCPCPNPACPTKPGVLCVGHYQGQLLALTAAFRDSPPGTHYHCASCNHRIGSPADAMKRWVEIA